MCLQLQPRSQSGDTMTEIDKPLFVRTIEQINHDIDRQLDLVEEEKRVSAEIHPPTVDRMSSCGRCYRERWFTIHGAPLDAGKGFRAPLLRIFRLGHVIEDELVDLINATPDYEVTDQQREVGVAPFLGHIDGILRWSRNGRIAKKTSLLEIKSAKTDRWQMLTKMGYAAWNPGYAAQIQAYLHFLPECEDAVIAVYDKDTSKIHWERIHRDEEHGTRLLEESSLATEGDMPPPRPKQATSQSCKYCKWCDRAQHCWSPATDARFDP